MQSIVPIIGHEFVYARPDLKSWVEFLLHERGWEIKWVDESTVLQLQTSGPEKIYLPFSLDLKGSDEHTHDHFTRSITEHFKTSKLIASSADTLASTITSLAPDISLWEKSVADKTIRNAISYMYKFIANADLHLPSLASSIGTSKTILEEKFHEFYDMGAMKFFRHIRVEQAKRILIETKDSIADIASYVGYSEYRSLIRPFKEAYKIAPLHYRKLSEAVKM